MIAVKDRIAREAEVVHREAHRVTDLSQDLASVVRRDAIAPGSRLEALVVECAPNHRTGAMLVRPGPG